MQANVHSRTVFPVGLLLEKRHCVVVGGGKVALHKTELLLEGQADVTVVAPRAEKELVALAEAGSIRYVPREFREADLAGAFLVFAATSDKPVNRDIVNLCREKKILCCPVDGNWVEGDFVTPAVFRKDGLTVSVSSGGRSCRRSRLVKENLMRHIEMVETADLIVIGTSHNELQIHRREPLHMLGKRLDMTGTMLMQVWGVHEFMLLNTCNRIEFIGVVSKETSIIDILKRVMAFFHLKEDEYYVKKGFEAFEHVAVVSAGLLSQSPGENNIVAQVKDAMEFSVQKGWAGGMIQEWIAGALHVSKDIRHVTAPLLGSREIEDLCIDYLKSQQAIDKSRRVAVIGTGTVGEGLVSRFVGLGCDCDWCYHVNKPAVPEAWASHVRLSTFNDFPSVLPKADTVVCTAASSGHVLHRGHAPFFDQEKEIMIVDLSMPRNVEPAMDGLTSNLKVVDLDGLKRWYRQEILDMAQVYELGKTISAEHKDLYAKIIQSFQGGNKSE